jgi:hypothetical protein
VYVVTEGAGEVLVSEGRDSVGFGACVCHRQFLYRQPQDAVQGWGRPRLRTENVWRLSRVAPPDVVTIDNGVNDRLLRPPGPPGTG